MIKILLIVWIVFIGWPLLSQPIAIDTIFVLENNSAHSTPFPDRISLAEDTVRNQYITSLSDRLRTQFNIHLKQAGPSASASISMRGSAGSQALLLWNGMAVQNVQLGLADFSNISKSRFSHVRVLKGSASAEWGSGAIGGIVLVENNDLAKNSMHTYLGCSVGSFGLFQKRMGIQLRQNGWIVNAEIFREKSRNDYKYNHPKYNIKGNILNGALLKHDFKLNAKYCLKQSELSFHFLNYSINRQIPNTIIQNVSSAYQRDEQLRAMLKYRSQLNNRSKLHISYAYVKDLLKFDDPLNRISSYSPIWTHWVQTDFSSRTFGIGWKFGVQYFHHRVKSDALISPSLTENIISPFLSLSRSIDRWTVNISLRAENIDARKTVIMSALRMNRQIGKNSKLFASLTKDHRRPGLNDRFFSPGGNPELKPESSLSQEIGFLLNTSNFELSTAIFHRKVDDWILWGLKENSSHIAAFNLASVRSKGVELMLNHRYSWKRHFVESAINIEYLKSINEVAVSIPNIKAGQSLYYTPDLMLSTSLSWTWHDKGLFNIDYQFTGHRIGINENMESFGVVGLLAEIHITSSISASIQVRNLFDTYYELIEYRPMQPRNYLLHFNYNFKT